MFRQQSKVQNVWYECGNEMEDERTAPAIDWRTVHILVMVNWPDAWQKPERSLPRYSPVIVLFSTSPVSEMPSWFGGPVEMLIPNDELFLKPPSNCAATPKGDSTAHGGLTVMVKFVTVTAEVLLCFNEAVKPKKEVVPSESRRTPDQLPSIVGLEPPHPTSRANAKRSPNRFIKAPFAKHVARNILSVMGMLVRRDKPA